jgi:uncharacterized protein (DUF58 family)
LASLCANHDVIAVRVSDPLDLEMNDAGLITFEDNETGSLLYAPTSSRSFRESWAEWHEERVNLWQAICRRWGAVALPLSTGDDAAVVLARFFRNHAGARRALRRNR